MINRDLLKIEKENAFSRSADKIREYKKKHPEREIISLGIGDVSKPVSEPVLRAMHEAVDDMGNMSTFKGYGLYFGLESLRKAILDNEYIKYGLSTDEIYVSEGTKSDSTNILELFDIDSRILAGNPMYPIYLNGALCLNRKVSFGDCDENFKTLIPEEHYDIIYLCSPNNPVGYALNRDELTEWVKYALKNKAVIILDNVYKAFTESKDVPESIYEIEGAKSCAIEMRSFSKSASFTGLRCSYYVLPKEIEGNLNPLWKERTINRFNGASYIVQKGAEATFLPEAVRQKEINIREYKENAKYLKENLEKLGYKVYGGVDAPYMWINTPKGMKSWEAFDFFLEELNIIVIPGTVFGSKGEGWLRISALGILDNSIKAIERIRKYHEKTS